MQYGLIDKIAERFLSAFFMQTIFGHIISMNIVNILQGYYVDTDKTVAVVPANVSVNKMILSEGKMIIDASDNKTPKSILIMNDGTAITTWMRPETLVARLTEHKTGG